MVKLSPWSILDVGFCLTVRNHPDLMKWFRQDEPLTIKEQLAFIGRDIWDHNYNGQIIKYKGKAVGLCAVKSNLEFSIAVLPEYQGKGIATKAMNLLLKGKHSVWSEVFVNNPALSWYLSKLGFKAVGVKERACYKQNGGMIDTVTIIRP